MISLVKKTLEIYLRERRVITSAEYGAENVAYMSQKNAVFVTLYFQWKVIASQGRITCKQENSLLECIDLTLSCLKDPRFSANFQNPELISQISVRIDAFDNSMRRQLKNISELTADEGIIFLSPSLGKMSVILPNMVTSQTPEKILDFAKQKADVSSDISANDYFVYGLKTTVLKD